MSNHDNGEPAFPCSIFDAFAQESRPHEGMELRDYFAAKAMAAIIQMDDRTEHNQYDESTVARNAYRMADAMLKERAK